MTGTSSARPSRLQAYPGTLRAMDEELDGLAGTLDDRLRSFKEGAGEFAPGFDPEATGKWVRDLAAESRHLGAWVEDVGNAFEEAGSSTTMVVSMDDTTLSKLVGEPSIREAERAALGQEDAAELRTALEAAGIDPDDFDVDQLWQSLDPRDAEYLELFGLMERIGAEMWSEDYAVGFYDQMNPDGMQATMAVIEMFAAHQQHTPLFDDDGGSDIPAMAPELGSIQERLLDPFVHGFAIASDSVDLEEERDGLLAPDDDINGDGRWQQHQLTMWLTDEGRYYDPVFLAEGADVILNTQAGTNWPNLDNSDSDVYNQSYPPLAIGSDLWDNPEFAFNELVAMRALADSDDASFEFLQLDGGEGRIDRLALLLQPNTYIIEGSVSGLSSYIDYDDAAELAAAMEQYGADIVDNAVVDAVQDVPLRYDAGLDIYADMVRVGGDGDVPDVTKRVLANAFALYMEDIGVAASRARALNLPDEQATVEDFNRVDLVNFFKELGYDEGAAAELGQAMGVWSTQASVPLLAPGTTETEVGIAYADVILVLAAMEDGFEQTGDAMEASHAGFVNGLKGGGALVTGLGLAAIPATGGASLLVTAAGALSGPLLDAGIDAAAGDADEAPLSPGELQRAVTQPLRESLARLIAERDGIPLPPPEDWVDLLSRTSPHGDPVNFLDVNSTVSGVQYEEDEHW